MPDLAVIVPARLGSQRFPRKLLHPVRGKPLVLWTADRLAQAVPDIPVHFAVAEEELKQVLEDAGYQAHLTDPELPSGTDRVAYLNASLDVPKVINAQADEPLVTSTQLRALAALLEAGSEMCTLACPFTEQSDFHDPNQVKVVFSQSGKALYFSRAPVPLTRDEPSWPSEHPVYRHLGLYGYSNTFLSRFVGMPQSPLEESERLEQLRALENGHSIDVALTDQPTLGVDVPADITRFEKLLDAESAR